MAENDAFPHDGRAEEQVASLSVRTPLPHDLDTFKKAFRRHAAGVSIVTALTPEGDPVGFTATSLASLAVVPPLATFNMARSAHSWSAIREANHLIVHILGANNRALAERMSSRREHRFTGDHWRAGPHGVPILTDVTGWMLGRIVKRISLHDSAVVIVQLEDGELGDSDQALFYHERRYSPPARANHDSDEKPPSA